MSRKQGKQNKKTGSAGNHPAHLANQVAPQGQSITVTEERFSGPLPPPTVIEGYEKACEGAAHRIITMAEEEGAHRRKQEQIDMQQYHLENKRGQWMIFILAIVAMGMGFSLAKDSIWVGGGTITAIATAFILAQSGILRTVIDYFRKRQ